MGKVSHFSVAVNQVRITPPAGTFLTNCERVGDHCSNFAVAMIEPAHDVFDTREYPDSLKKVKDAAFNENYEAFRQWFRI